MILSILIFTGISRQELLGLDWDDVDFKEQTLKIQKYFYAAILFLYLTIKKLAKPPNKI